MTERVRRDVDTLLLPALCKKADIGTLLVGPFITSQNRADPMWRVPVVINIDTEIKGLVAGRYARPLMHSAILWNCAKLPSKLLKQSREIP